MRKLHKFSTNTKPGAPAGGGRGGGGGDPFDRVPIVVDVLSEEGGAGWGWRRRMAFLSYSLSFGRRWWDWMTLNIFPRLQGQCR